jgi:hypothetical protein
MRIDIKTKEELEQNIRDGWYDDYELPMLSREQNVTIILDMLLDNPELIREKNE